MNKVLGLPTIEELPKGVVITTKFISGLDDINMGGAIQLKGIKRS